MATIWDLVAKLGLDSKPFTDGLGEAERKASSSGAAIAGNLGKVGGSIVTGGLMLAGAGITALTAGLVSSVGAAAEAESIQAQLGAVLTSTGGAAGVTAEMANDLAESMSNVTRFEDDAIVSGEAMLLTFTNIGSDVFPATTQAMLDMSQAMGTDLNGSAIMLGKALNDPTQGISALTRVGVTFTEEQKKLIESLQESGDMAGAQGVILAELQKEFGGSAEAAGKTFAGSLDILKNKMGNIQETVGTALLPVLATLATTLSEKLADPATQETIANIAQGIADFAVQVITWIPQVISLFQSWGAWLANNQGVIVGVLAAIGIAIAAFVYTTVIPALIAFITAAAPVILIMAAVGLAGYLLYQAWTTNFGGIQEIVAGLWTKIQPVFETIKTWLAVNIPIALQTLASFWQNTLLPAIQAVWGWMQSTLFPFLGSLANLIGAVLGLAISTLAGLWQNVLQPALEAVWPILQDIGNFVGGALTDAFGWLSGAIQTATKWFNDLATMLQNLKIPDWLTPGSPTPLQIGIEGIAGAVKDLASAELPTLKAGLEFGGATMSASGMGSGGFTSGDIIDYDRLARVLRDALAQVM
jgi:hypothetical protein